MAISKIGSKALVDCSVAAVDIEDGSITGAKLAGSIANAKLANSSITVNGTTINLGASGSVPAVSWQSVVVSDGSTITTMVAGNGYFVNNTSAAGLVKLPTSASAGDTIAIKDYAGNFGTNNLTIQRNGHTIQGVANDSLISTDKASLTLVYVDATKGWLYAVESNVGALVPTFIIATGGTITTVDTDYKVHTFTGDGCFVVSQIGSGGIPSVVDYLVVAGGGGGAGSATPTNQSTGGGGGAGGYRESHSVPVSGCYTASPLATPTGLTVTATTYPVTAGGGGTGGALNTPTCSDSGGYGSNSGFSTITSTGGGGGGRVITAGNAGGSGGGGGGEGNVAGGTGNSPPVSPAQGTNGGAANSTAPQYGGGGGGGATVAGTAGTSSSASGCGGNGATTSISASPTVYAGGGGGGMYNIPACQPQGGTGGGGNGSLRTISINTVGTTNTGGGGGGSTNGTPGAGSAGGSGIVIIRYKFQ